MRLIVALLLLTVSLSAQKVEVTPQFLDDANAAFKELPLRRAEAEAWKKANDANVIAVAALQQVNELLKADNADLRKLKCDSGSLFFVIRWKQCK